MAKVVVNIYKSSSRKRKGVHSKNKSSKLKSSKNYIKRYNIVFEDLLGYHHLNRLILEKENKFK